MNEPATFDLFVREMPPGRAFLVSAGLEPALHYLEHLHFDADQIAYLRSLRMFSDAFLDYLRAFRFTGDVWAIPEGEVFFPLEPLLEVREPRRQLRSRLPCRRAAPPSPRRNARDARPSHRTPRSSGRSSR